MLTFQQFIAEDWVTDIQNSFGTKTFKVFENPSSANLAAIKSEGYDNDVRVLVSTTGKVYAFNALLIHASVITKLKLDTKKTYKGIGLIKNGKIALGVSREPYSVLLNNPIFDYSKLYYEDPYLAFEKMKSNCSYMYHPIFTEDSVDALLMKELKNHYR